MLTTTVHMEAPAGKDCVPPLPEPALLDAVPDPDLGVEEETWKQLCGLEEVQQWFSSTQPILHHSCTQDVAAGKPPGQELKTSPHMCIKRLISMPGGLVSQ